MTELKTTAEEGVKIGYSNISSLLGMTITVADRDKGIIEASFNATEQFHNSIGNIQGGILTAMLDDLMGYALGITMPSDRFAPTANLNVSFLRPAAAGILHGRGEILKQDNGLYQLAGKLYNARGELLAAATCKAKAGQINRV
ncbi:MAG: PaaI family thioesterase [Pseudomonadales bacterium]|nr:PaaI family thioesterase [Pseudomonadales bacterium]